MNKIRFYLFVYVFAFVTHSCIFCLKTECTYVWDDDRTYGNHPIHKLYIFIIPFILRFNVFLMHTFSTIRYFSKIFFLLSFHFTNNEKK